MVNKCAVFGCKRGYESEEPQHEDYHAFYFPLDERKSHLLPALEKFVCRDGWKPSTNSVICEFHFEDRLIRKGKRWTLKWKLNPMPTMLTKNWQKGLIATVVNRYLLQVQWTWQKTIT